MLLPKHIFLCTILFLLVPLFTACSGSQESNQNGSTSTHQVTATISRSNPTTTPNVVNDLIHTTTATVQGKKETILITTRGKTLYYRTTDKATTVCSNTCAQTWPPLLNSGTPNSSTPLPGQLSVAKTANGQQVEYQGHPLYTYRGDSSPGQTNGQGIGGIWFVVPINLAV